MRKLLLSMPEGEAQEDVRTAELLERAARA